MLNNFYVKEMSAATFGAGFDDLPGSKSQIDKISDLLKQYGWKVSKHLGAGASEENVKKINSPSVLHIATHGFFLPEEKLPIKIDVEQDNKTEPYKNTLQNSLFRSGLALAGANNTIIDSLQHDVMQLGYKEDGILTAFEAGNLNLNNTELVDLSACETGLGQVITGEGVYGLQRAFRMAGAKSLIMSLRPVNDEATQLLMSSFYRLWSSGMGKQEAFRAAQQELKKTFPAPYFWGGFVMTGE